MEDRLAWGEQVLAAQPFSVLLGAGLLSFSKGGVELKVPIKAELMQQHGFVHGGVISYAVDNALLPMRVAVLWVLVWLPRSSRSTMSGRRWGGIVARAIVIHAGKNQAVCRCEVYVSSRSAERLCAMAQGTVTRVGQPSESRT